MEIQEILKILAIAIYYSGLIGLFVWISRINNNCPDCGREMKHWGDDKYYCQFCETKGVKTK